MKNKIVLSHPTGNANVRAAANGFVRSGILNKFHTTIAAFPNTILGQLSQISAFAEIRRRSYDKALLPYTELHPWWELGRLISAKFGLNRRFYSEHSLFSIDSIYKKFDQKVASTLKSSSSLGARSVYAYDDGALFSFLEAKQLGMSCFYDLPTGYWRAAQQLLSSEYERWPDWISTMPGFKDSEKKLARKDEELRLADGIFVASKFTKKTLNEFPGKLAPIIVIPYGFPPVVDQREYRSKASQNPLKLLFVGKLSQQKGIADLFAAVKAIGNKVTLTLVGNKVAQSCPALDKELAYHRWIPSLAHADVLHLMQQHDVLVFPSLFDGFGLVITEAMSQGTPVIASTRCAGPDLIEHGRNGWLVDAASTSALQESIETVLDNSNLIPSISREAIETARQRPWDIYGYELVQAIETLLKVQTSAIN